MKIGIPRGLYYYYYGDLWINFFKYLNVNIIISPLTNKEIIDLGIKYSQDEMCFSVKNYIGHIAYLKDKCDYIIIPRPDNYGRDNQTCTNFLAIYDIINNLFDIKILNYNINLLNNEKEIDGFIKIGKSLGYSKNKSVKAYRKAKKISGEIKASKSFENLKKLNSKNKKVLLVGHSYNIHDKLINNSIIKLLVSNNIEVIYNDEIQSKYDDSYTKGLYWKYIKDELGNIKEITNLINGIIFLESFPCGLDSLVIELIIRKIDKPYLNLIIDDINSLVGIETRIESFIDIINDNYKVGNRC